jgi:hypothetical protein
VTFIQPLCTIQATEGASFPTLFEREQYSYQDTPLYQGIEDNLGGELESLKGSDGTFDLVYMKEIYDGTDTDKDSKGQEKGKPESKVITNLVDEIATLL